MQRLLALALVAAAACKSPAKQTPTVPSSQLDSPKVEPKVATVAPVEAPPPVVLAPIHVSIPAPKVTVKMLGKGKATTAKLALTPKQGAKQPVEVALDYTTKENGTGATVIPTVVLIGETEVKSVAADGTFQQVFTVTAVDVRNGSAATPADKLRPLLASLVGMTIVNMVAANGVTGDVEFHIEKPNAYTAQALQLVGLAWPTWPAFPPDAIGPGGKWQTSTTMRLADRFEITVVTDYALVSRTGTTWKATGKVKVTGANQTSDGGTISDISGGGDIELALDDSAVAPTFKTTVMTKFKASEKDNSMAFELSLGATVSKPTAKTSELGTNSFKP